MRALSSVAKPILRADYRPPAFDIPNCKLSFDVFEEHTSVLSEFELERLPWVPTDVLALDGDACLELQSIHVNGALLTAANGDYELKHGGAQLVIPVRVLFGSATDVAKVAIRTKLRPAANTQLSGL